MPPSRRRREKEAGLESAHALTFCARPADYLDRTNLGNARTLNSDKPGESLVETLALKGLRYNIIVAIFFVPCELALSLRRSYNPSQAEPSPTLQTCSASFRATSP